MFQHNPNKLPALTWDVLLKLFVESFNDFGRIIRSAKILSNQGFIERVSLCKAQILHVLVGDDVLVRALLTLNAFNV